MGSFEVIEVTESKGKKKCPVWTGVMLFGDGDDDDDDDDDDDNDDDDEDCRIRRVERMVSFYVTISLYKA